MLLLQVLTKEKKSEVLANPNHNRGLRPSLRYVNKFSRKLNSWVDIPDVEVLGAVVAIEDWFKGPKINFSFGRKKGKCA
jgi:hypothetical protein